MTDARALKILTSKYWSPAGWKPEAEQSVDPKDFAYARSMGVMFDDRSFDHSDVVAAALRARDDVDRRVIADSFVVSLGMPELDRRSALGSYAVLQNLPGHGWSGRQAFCDVCGGRNRHSRSEDLNILNFERLKWGGVRHLDPLYAAFDLERFALLDPVAPQPGQIALLRELLDTISSAPARTTSAALHGLLPRRVARNKAERDVLVGILGLCGVLETADHHGFLRAFVPEADRKLPDRRFVDMAYPACWWTGADGVNWGAVEYWFGHLR